MKPPTHPTDGLVLSGSLTIDPPLDGDGRDLLEAISWASLRSCLEGETSGLVDQLAPGHPDGPCPWVACPDGCCLDMSEEGLVLMTAIEPWLAYLVRAPLAGHDVSGAVVMWDCADRSFSALTVEGTRVGRREILQGRSRRLRSV